MSAGGPNPILLVRENLEAFIADLDEERAKIIKRLHEIHEAAAIARTLQDVVPVLPEKEPTDTKHSTGQSRKPKDSEEH